MLDRADNELLRVAVGRVGGDMGTLSLGVFGSRDDWTLEEAESFAFVSKIALNRLDMEFIGVLEFHRRASGMEWSNLGEEEWHLLSRLYK